MPPPASKSQPARAVLWWWWTTTPAQLAAALLFLVGAGAIQVPEDSVPVNTRSAHPDKITDEMVEQMSHFGMSESQFRVKGDAFQKTAAQLVRERQPARRMGHHQIHRPCRPGRVHQAVRQMSKSPQFACCCVMWCRSFSFTKTSSCGKRPR